MKFGNGIVKKYSREYNRTLKNGEKKKYTTEQIQITVPVAEPVQEPTVWETVYTFLVGLFA